MNSSDARRTVETWSKAFTNADVNGIVNLYAPDAIMIGTFSKSVLTTPQDIRNYFEVALNKDRPRTATLNSSEIVVVDDNTVVMSGFDTITSVKEGKPTATNGRVTFVVAKRGADWKIVHMHRSLMPPT